MSRVEGWGYSENSEKTLDFVACVNTIYKLETA